MDVRKYLVVLFALLILPTITYGYGAHTTHPALTQEILRVFNDLYPEIIFSKEEKEIIKKGSIDEDESWRFMRHFFEPIRNTGLTFATLGNGLQSWPTAMEWSINTKLQAEKDSDYSSKSLYFSAETDFTWDRAIYEYVYGDRSRSLYALGHILHLVEDMTVPPHTRDDPHPPVGEMGSVYEAYAEQFTPENIRPVGYRPLDKLPLRITDLIREVALYTNQNFYSKDTLPNFGFEYEKIEETGVWELENGGETISLVFSLGQNGSYFLARIEVLRDVATGKIKKEYSLVDPAGLVMNDYWRLLSQAALRYGVATIELFFSDVQKEIENGDLYALQYPSNQEGRISSNLAALSGFVVKKQSVVVAPAIKISSVTNDGNKEVPDYVPQINIADRSVLVDLDTGLDAHVVQIEDFEPEVETAPSDVYPSLFAIPSGAVGSGGSSQRESGSASSVQKVAVDIAVEESTPLILSAPVLECNDSIVVGECIVANNSITILHSGADTGWYEIKYGDVISTTTSSRTVLEVASSTQDISVRVCGGSGDCSDSASLRVVFTESPLVISEVAWMGTQASDDDQWIELKNLTNYEIDLSKFSLVFNASNSTTSLSGRVGPGGYVVIEHKHPETINEFVESPIPSISAGLWLQFASLLNQEGDQVKLIVGSTTVDQTPPLDSCGGWCAGSAAGSMERVNFLNTDAAAWESWLNIFTYATDTENLPIFGTPDGRNSRSYTLPEVHAGDVVELSLANSPYVAKDGWDIPINATATIPAGVVIKLVSFGANINIGGTLLVDGTENQPVVFTALADDAFGGDLERNGSSTLSRGLWRTLSFGPKSGMSRLNNLKVRYGGTYTNSTVSLNRAAVKISGSSPIFDALEVSYAKENGMVLINGSKSEITNSVFVNNGSGSALYVSASSPVLSNNAFYNNVTGLNATVSGLQAEGNYFENNVDPVVVDRLMADAYIKRFSGRNNDLNAIRLITLASGTTTLFANSLPYYVTGLEVPRDSTLVVQPGVALALQSNPIRISGVLEMKGDELNPITVTSKDNDSVLGDMFNNGTNTIDIGRQTGLLLFEGSRASFVYTVLSYLKTALWYESGSTPLSLSHVAFLNNITAINLPANATSTVFEFVTFDSNTSTSTNELPH